MEWEGKGIQVVQAPNSVSRRSLERFIHFNLFWLDKKVSCIANEYTCVLESSVNTRECQPVRLESDFKLLFIVETEEMCFPAEIMDPSRNDYQVLWETLSKLSLHPCGDRRSVRLRLLDSLSLTGLQGTAQELGFLCFTYWKWENWHYVGFSKCRKSFPTAVFPSQRQLCLLCSLP